MLILRSRISVLKRWFKTPIQNALHGSSVPASLEKKTISWACTAHCSRLLFELKWTGKAFIWRHLNVVICDFAFMLPPESAFALTTIVKRTFLGCVHAYFAKAESAFWNGWFKTPIQNALHGSTVHASRGEEDDFVSMHCALIEAIVRAQVNRKGVYMTSFKRGYMWFAFMLPPESAFCSNHDRKRTFLGVLNQRFETTFYSKISMDATAVLL